MLVLNNMEFGYDKDADAAYIYLVYPIKPGEAKNQRELNEDIILDFDEKGKIPGIEILSASKVLNKKALLKALTSYKGRKSK